MGILKIAEANLEVQFMLGVIVLSLAFLPFLHNLEGLLQDFTPEKSHHMMSIVFNTLYYSAMVIAIAAAVYIYSILQGVTGILTSS